MSDINGQLSQRNISLSVLSRPMVKISNLTMTVEKGTAFTLMCEASVPATGHPDLAKGVNITWLENGVPTGRYQEKIVWYK